MIDALSKYKIFQGHYSLITNQFSLLSRSFILTLLFAACGKVGDPLPPFIRIPEPVSDLKVQQVGRNLVLTWTNPARNIDGSVATDLARARILSNGTTVQEVEVSAGGQGASFTLPVGNIGASRSFAVQVETAARKASSVSNTVSITPVEVPGTVSNLKATVDQRKIILEWGRPPERPELANVYSVARTDGGLNTQTENPRIEDDAFQVGRDYTYEVRAVRREGDELIFGEGPVAVTVTAVDKTPPQTPSGFEATSADTGGFLTWASNTETDLAGYRVFRSDRPDGSFIPVGPPLHQTNAFFDPAYRAGLYYIVSALDDSGNESMRSSPFRVQ